MSLDEVIFWVALVPFSTGVYWLPDYPWWWSLPMIGVGTGGIIYVARQHLVGAATLSLVSIVLMFLTWGAVGYDTYARHTALVLQNQIQGQIQVLGSWGGGVEMCNAIVDGSKLSTWDSKYRVALVCGFQDSEWIISMTKE